MFRVLCILCLLLPAVVWAQTAENLTLSNAFPDEIIDRLNTPPKPVQPVNPVQNIVKLGTVVSLYQHKDNPDLFDFTLSLTDDSVIIVTQENDLDLKPGDSVLISEEEGKTIIKSRVVTP